MALFNNKVAVVTGSNKGIGLAIVRGLCRKFDGDVILTARDENRGLESVKKLEAEGLKPKFHQLAIDDESSIENLKTFLEKQYGGIDVLVNNAGVAFGRASTATAQEQAETTLAINYFATKNVCRILFPLLRKHSRVVNISSYEGRVVHIINAEKRAKFTDLKLKEDDLDELVKSYLKDIERGVHIDEGWADNTYRMSKIALTALTFIQHRKLSENADMDIVINAVHPGYVETDMSNHKGNLTTDQGANSALYACLLPPNCDSPRGQFVMDDCTVGDWDK